MIDMTVGEDDSDQRFVFQVFHGKGPGGCSSFRGRAGVNDNPAAVTLNEGYVCQIETAKLINSLGHFEQAVNIVQAGLPPQARIDAAGCLALNKVIGWHIPHRVPVFAHHLQCRHSSNQAAFGIGKILSVGEGQLLEYLGISFNSGCRGRAVSITVGTGVIGSLITARKGCQSDHRGSG